MLVLLVSHLAQALASFSSDSCMVEGEACLAEGDTMLATIPGIPEVATCRQLCQDTERCQFLSHFGPESFPLREHCLLFSSCSSLHRCQDCRTEDRNCYSTCGADVQVAIGENDLEVITGVITEVDCKLNCSANPNCSVYTYFDISHPHYPTLCFLLSEVLEPVEPCEHCRTGFPECGTSSAGSCSFTVGADPAPKQSQIFNTAGTTNVTVSPLAALVGCKLAVVAVGGGGAGSSGGGGSGHVASRTVGVTTVQLVVWVGGAGEKSTLNTGEGEEVVSAAPGESGSREYGGAGYSGGGGYGDDYYYGAGGEDGGNGHGSRGGLGSGLDLSSPGLMEFTLSPGAGGTPKLSGMYGFYVGGGGGGVFVNGVGPSASEHTGEGYGGGGGGSGYSGDPGSGLVLLQIKKTQ